MIKFTDVEFVKFLIVGLINTIVGSSVMFLLYNAAHFSYWVSSSFNYIIGGMVSFFLNKYFTFKNTKKSFRQIILFMINLAFCYFISYVFAKWLIYGLFINNGVSFKDNISMLLGMCLYTGLNYLGQRIFVFNKEKQDE